MSILSFWFANYATARLSKKESDFIAKYSLNKTHTAQLDGHKDEILALVKNCTKEGCKQKHPVWELPFLPGYLMKRSYERIEGREKIMAVIKEYNIDRIIVPEKWLYHIPGRPEILSIMNYFVIVPKLIPKKTHQPLTLLEVQQLCTIIEETGYCDMQKPNIIRLENGLIAMIDTDPWAFGYEPYLGIMRFLTYYGEFDIKNDFTPDAIGFILKELEKYQPRVDKDAYKEFYQKLDESLKRHRELFKQFQSRFRQP